MADKDPSKWVEGRDYIKDEKGNTWVLSDEDREYLLEVTDKVQGLHLKNDIGNVDEENIPSLVERCCDGTGLEKLIGSPLHAQPVHLLSVNKDKEENNDENDI